MDGPQAIAPEVLALPVVGNNLVPGTLADQLGKELTLLLFLRHFG
jgi:hypothetical protein